MIKRPFIADDRVEEKVHQALQHGPNERHLSDWRGGDNPDQQTPSIIRAIEKRLCSIFRGYYAGIRRWQSAKLGQLPLIEAYSRSFPVR